MTVDPSPEAHLTDATQRLRPLRADHDSGVQFDPVPPNVVDTPFDLARPCDTEFPRPGESFLHFELLEEIGRGSFARVFLARQESLANRLVVLKVTTTPTDEPQNLARFQHTNVVPVYSVHNAGTLQALCMPYLGRVTLAQILETLANRLPQHRRDGSELLASMRPAAPSPAYRETVAALAASSFLDGCLWFIGQLAAGLEHAHARHILHRDLKPANVLVTDDGVPMLLDFNVACESARCSAEGMLGGTLPYMAPEHLRAFLQPDTVVDERGDLYSLGVILYELLTGHYPYPLPTAATPEAALTAMIAQHTDSPPPPSWYDATIPPALDAIALKLLDPVAGNRYSCAADLREDIARQLANRPLRYARNTSAHERVRKWRRRNPGLAVAVATFLALILPTAWIALRQAEIATRTSQLQRAEAEGIAHQTDDDLKTAEALLGSRADPQHRDQGLKLGQEILSRYGVADESFWEARREFALLTVSERARLKQRFGELLILMARAEAERPNGLAAARRWNERSVAMFTEDTRPAVIARHRQEFAHRQSGQPMAPFVAPDPATARLEDLYFDGLDLASADRHAEALPLLARFCDETPTHFLAWFARGVCHDALNQPADAVTAFTVCESLWPESSFAPANRGLAYLRLRRYSEAETDFTRVLARKPGWWVAHLNRGLAREGLRRHADAEADFTAALADTAAPTRLYFLRSRVRLAAGNAAGAAEDRREGLTREPTDALSWGTRGSWHLTANQPHKALADFDAALALSPKSRDALLNKAIVLANHLHREADAIPILDQLLELYPDQVDARCSRGVYHARLGHAAEAARDAAAALKVDHSAYRQFQVAGLFAQLAKADATARTKAIEYLNEAIKRGFNDVKLLKGDTDLDPLRRDPAFEKIVALATQIDKVGH